MDIKRTTCNVLPYQRMEKINDELKKEKKEYKKDE
jgi:hypothetical protein